MPKTMPPKRLDEKKPPAESPHPLASLMGAWKDTEKLKTLVERVENYRREVEAKENAGA